LFSAHRDGVFRYLSRLVGYGQAGELTQEVFLRVARGPVPVADEGRRRAWVFRIARNLAHNHVRDGRRRGTPVELEDAPSAATQEIDAAVREALERLATLDRDVFLMRETAGLSYADIAVACKLSPDAVRSRLHRARQQLRAALSPALARTPITPGVRLYDRSDRD
jgi:RNA polymerase sigma-70 factor (ECF subfamily)